MNNARLTAERSSFVPGSRKTGGKWCMGRSSTGLLASILILSLLAIQGTQAWASTAVNPTMNVTTTTVWTNHLKVQLFFPASAYPGETEQISTTTTVKSSGRIVRLSLDVSSYVGKQLVRIASQTIISDKAVKSGDSWRSWLLVVIPANAQPGALIGRVTELWEETSNYYSPYYGTPYHAPYCPYYEDRGYHAPNYGYYSTYTYNTQDYVGYQKGLTASRTSPRSYPSRYVYQPGYGYEPSYGCEPALYYDSNHAPNYGPSYVAQSGQGVLLTYVLSCPPRH